MIRYGSLFAIINFQSIINLVLHLPAEAAQQFL